MKTNILKKKNCKNCKFNYKFTCTCINSPKIGSHISIFGQTACNNFKEK